MNLYEKNITPQNSTAERERFYYLDAVRAFALLLGIVFHASLSFVPIFIGWAVMDVSTSDLASVFVLISHSFRMELFFLIAGFFSHMTFHRDGYSGFFKSRLVRIGIPLIIGWFVLRPLLVSGWVMGAESMQGDVNIWNGLLQGMLSLTELPQGFLTGSHLWFLYYLLLISASVIAVRFVIKLHPVVKKMTSHWADRCMAYICRSRFAVDLLVIPTAGCVWFMSHWGVDTPDKTLVPLLPVALLYGGFFSFGWLLHRQTSLLSHLARLSWSRAALCVFSIIVTVFLSGFETQHSHVFYPWLKLSYMLGYATMMWSLILLTLGVFRKLLDRPSKTVRYVADSSYWLYLIHLPIVIFLQIAFAELEMVWGLKLIAISAITIIASILVYDAFIRSTVIGKILNGKRKPRLIFARWANSVEGDKSINDVTTLKPAAGE